MERGPRPGRTCRSTQIAPSQEGIARMGVFRTSASHHSHSNSYFRSYGRREFGGFCVQVRYIEEIMLFGLTHTKIETY